MNAVDGVARRDVANDADRVVGGGGIDRRQVQAFDIGLTAARVSEQPPEVLRTARIDRGEIGRQRARHHQPLGMPIDDVIARRGQIETGDEVDVDPRVHAQARLVGARDRRRERIERCLTVERRRPRLDAALVVRVTASADLDQQRVEAAALRRRDHRRNLRRRGQRRAHDPQRANFVARHEWRRTNGPHGDQHRHHTTDDGTEHGSSGG